MKAEGGRALVSLPTGFTAAFDTVQKECLKDGLPVMLCARPEELIVQPKDQPGIRAVVDDCVFLGLNTHYFVHLLTGEKAEIIQESKIEDILEKGSTVHLSVKGEKINIFTETGETSLIKSHRGD